MTRTTFDNYGLAHAYASMSQDHGKSANGNFFFTGSILYSYGSHFPICRYLEKQDVMLFTSDSYSVSTARHISLAESATRHFDKIYIPDLEKVCRIIDTRDKSAKRRDAIKLIDSWGDDIARIEAKIAKMRAQWKIDSAHGEIAQLEKSANFLWSDLCKQRGNPFSVASKATKAEKLAREKRDYAAKRDNLEMRLNRDLADLENILQTQKETAFNSGNAWELSRFIEQMQTSVTGQFPDAIGPMGAKNATRVMGAKWVKEVKAMQNECEQKFAPLRDFMTKTLNERDEQIARDNADKIAAWIDGESVSLPHNVPMMLRVKGETLETSQGAKVPLTEAKTLTRAAILCRKTATPWQRNGQKKPVGMFQTDKISAQGDLRVGCHLIPWQAIADCVNRFAPELVEKVNAVN